MISLRNGTKNGTISLFIGSVSSRMQTRNHSVFSILEFAKKILVFSSFLKFAKNKSNFRTLILVRNRTKNGTIKDFLGFISETKTESYIAFFYHFRVEKKKIRFFLFSLYSLQKKTCFSSSLKFSKQKIFFVFCFLKFAKKKIYPVF